MGDFIHFCSKCSSMACQLMDREHKLLSAFTVRGLCYITGKCVFCGKPVYLVIPVEEVITVMGSSIPESETTL